ncbi:unnamed protein product [Caenorhabditis auriculariae]|uniref:T-cell immunomodulatory protein TIP C2 domain-containing protein n=1 Tax=Caenorhabditis auriculariae TaxID=2777116 RepID=A0A8S1HYZ0_9PELO|nr:unnamed protein product [Caenorhabditis auriculariae]
MMAFNEKLDKCVAICADDHIKLIPTIKERFAKNLMKTRWLTTILTTLLIAKSSQVLKKVAPEHYGRVCAFGDFNADRNTDLLVSIGRNLSVLLQDNKILDVLETGRFTNSTSWEISNEDLGDTIECVLGDFNGDSRLDILTSIRNGDNDYDHVLWMAKELPGSATDVFFKVPVGKLAQQALAVDVNGDGQHDILGFFPNGSLFCTQVGSDSTITFLDDCRSSFKFFPTTVTLYPGMPHLFVDLNDSPPDLNAELVFMTKEGDDLDLQVWQQTKVGWRAKSFIPKLPYSQYPFIGAPMATDIDADGNMDIVVPICREAQCSHVTSLAVFAGKQRGWVNMAIDLQDLEVLSEKNSRVLFRFGDFDNDGFPDLIALLVNKASNTPYSKVIGNIDCKNCEKNGTRKFEIAKLELIQPKDMALGTANMATFFDLEEDGKLDIMVEYSLYGQQRFGFIYCEDKGDTTFLKVQIFTSVCSGRCVPAKTEIGSGISWGGACASFSILDSYGKSQKSMACQNPSNTYRTFLPPFILFGLGRSPNFVDELHIGIPKYTERLSDQQHTLKQIVPNSRLVVLPPADGSHHWLTRLYVTPSQLIVQSLIVIASVCLMLLLVVGVMHWREKKEDRFERQQQSYRFHFDGM